MSLAVEMTDVSPVARRGIAAPQIQVPRRFIAVNMGDGARVLSDPVVTFAGRR